MYKTKRFVCLLVAMCILITAALAGCGVKRGEPASASRGTESATGKQEESTKAELKEVQLSWYLLSGGIPRDDEMVEEEVNKYIKDKINATIDLVYLDWGSFQQKRDAMLASGEFFDITFCPAWMGYWTHVAKGAFTDLTDLLDQYAPKTKSIRVPALLDGCKYNGRIYAIACNKEAAQHWGLMFNKDLVDKHNIDLSKIKKPQDLEQYLQLIKEKEPDVIPFGVKPGWSLAQMVGFGLSEPIGGHTFGSLPKGSNDFKVSDLIYMKEFEEALKLQHSWYKKGYINKNCADKNVDLSGALTEGKIFVRATALKPYADKESSVNSSYPFVQLDLTDAYITTDSTTNSMQVIPRTSKNPERALMFLELFNTDQYLNNLITHGIEGVHYKKISNNKIEPADGIDIQNHPYSLAGMAWALNNQFITYLNKAEPDDKYSKYEEYNKNAVVSKILGFTGSYS